MSVKNFKRKILDTVVEAFNSSASTMETRVSTEKIYKEYYTCTGILDFDAFEEFEEAIKEGIEEGLFRATRNERCNVYKTIIATEEQSEKIAKMLGKVSRKTYVNHLTRVLQRYQSSTCSQVRDWVELELSKRNLKQAKDFMKYSGDIKLDELEKFFTTLLSGCEAIAGLTQDILRRNLSVNYGYGDSKAFEKLYMKKTAKILSPELSANDVDEKEILKLFHVLENPASVWVKGCGRFDFQNGDRISLNSKSDGLAFSRAYIEEISSVSAAGVVLSIENLTTFNSYTPKQGELVVFTSGYANSLVVDFIKKCSLHKTIKEFRHFGDLDAYGFDILKNLKERTSVDIRPYMMNTDTYKANRTNAIPMTTAHRDLMQKQVTMNCFSEESKELFQLLLEEDKMLEQEGIK